MNPEKTTSEKATRPLVKDPVCNMDVNPVTAAGSSEYKSKTYYFCSPGCVKRFNPDPEKYLAPRMPAAGLPKTQMVQIGGIIPAPAAAPPLIKPVQDDSAGTGTVTYVCPMDPEVRESKPGACPKCGMALEPETIGATEDEDNSELRDITPRFWIHAG